MLIAMECLPFPQPHLGDQLKYCYYNGIDLTLPVAEGPQYVLTGAAVHHGSTTSSNHFVSIIRCPESGSHDSQSTVVITHETEARVLKKTYMVTYSKENETLQSLNILFKKWNNVLFKKIILVTSQESSLQNVVDIETSHFPDCSTCQEKHSWITAMQTFHLFLNNKMLKY